MRPQDYHAKWPGSDHYSNLISDPDEQGVRMGGCGELGRAPSLPKEKKGVGASFPRAACPPATNSHYTNTLLPTLEPFITSFPESPLAAA